MKRGVAALFIFLLLCGCGPAVPDVKDGSVETKTGVVVDRARNDDLPYVGVEFEDGSGDCFYGLEEGAIPDGIAVGDPVALTYGFDQRTNRWFVMELCKIE